MQFDELCALVGALRDRVAELEAKVATLESRQTKVQVIDSGLPGGRWRVDAISSKHICDAAAQGVRSAITTADRNRLS